MQCHQSGDIVINASANHWSAWLTGTPIDDDSLQERRDVLDTLCERIAFLDDGVHAEWYTDPKAPVGSDTSMRMAAVAPDQAQSQASEVSVGQWSGELLWPSELAHGPIIDARRVTAVGVWMHAWLREQPHTAVVGLHAAARNQLQNAGCRCCVIAPSPKPQIVAGSLRLNGQCCGSKWAWLTTNHGQ